MSYTSATVEEMNLLLQFDSDSMERGIKVHSSARAEVIEACQRLHTKGLISQADGGYLTHAGLEAQGHAQALCGLLAANDTAGQ